MKDSGFRRSQALKSDTLPLLIPSACQAAHAGCCFGPGPCLVPREPTGWGSRGLWWSIQAGAVPRGTCPCHPLLFFIPGQKENGVLGPMGGRQEGRRCALCSGDAGLAVQLTSFTTPTSRSWSRLCPLKPPDSFPLLALAHSVYPHLPCQPPRTGQFRCFGRKELNPVPVCLNQKCIYQEIPGELPGPMEQLDAQA